ncbi:MAG: RHS repeat-associated core domain-containing protein [Chitinophagales bacterium]
MLKKSVQLQTLTTVERNYVLQHLHDYFPYGKTLREWYPNDFDPQERYQTTQHQRDFETNFDYRGARLYDADAGRFLSLDPLAADYPSWSDYNYVLGNPVIFVDPDGKSPGDSRFYITMKVRIKQTFYKVEQLIFPSWITTAPSEAGFISPNYTGESKVVGFDINIPVILHEDGNYAIAEKQMEVGSKPFRGSGKLSVTGLGTLFQIPNTVFEGDFSIGAAPGEINLGKLAAYVKYEKEIAGGLKGGVSYTMDYNVVLKGEPKILKFSITVKLKDYDDWGDATPHLEIEVEGLEESFELGSQDYDVYIEFKQSDLGYPGAQKPLGVIVKHSSGRDMSKFRGD